MVGVAGSPAGTGAEEREADVLVVGGGAGGLWAAISAKRADPRLRVALVDARMTGRTGHTAFSNAWFVMALPEDDLEAWVADIVHGNEWMADQELVAASVAMSYDRLKDMERYGMTFPQEDGTYARRPTRGLRVCRVIHPDGGGLDFAWRLRQACEQLGVLLWDRLFVTRLATRDGRVTGAHAVHGRLGTPVRLRARATVIATNSLTFRAGFVRDITGTGTMLAYAQGAPVTQAEFSYLRPSTPKFYFEGITFAIQDGARFTNRHGEAFMRAYEPDWGDQADVQRIARAMCLEKRRGNDPVYLDMRGVREDRRPEYFHSAVAWMDRFLQKLDSRARIDMFGQVPYYPLAQMTKLALLTDAGCRSPLPGLYAAGLAQATCATHFAGFHIGACIGSGWTAGRSAAEDAPGLPLAREDAPPPAPVVDADASARSDEVLLALQRLMFRFDVAVLKRPEALREGLETVDRLDAELAAVDRVPHVHEYVRLEETRHMVGAARLMLSASLYRDESRLSHMREDCPERDDARWCSRVVVARDAAGGDAMHAEPIPCPYVPPPPATGPSQGVGA